MSKEISVTTTNTAMMLGVAFVVLKLTGVINWSWWWVTLPFYAGIIVALLFVTILVLLRIRK